MVSPESFDREYVAVVEERVWPLLAAIGEALAKFNYPSFLADSSPIRFYVPHARDLGDIDFILPQNTDADFLLQCVRSGLASLEQELEIVEHLPAFLRTVLPIGLSYRGQDAFIVDFHFGGSVYAGSIVWAIPNSEYFKRVRLCDVPDISGRYHARLPILPLEDIVGLKLSKNLRLDIIDVLAALAAERFHTNCVDGSIQGREQVVRTLYRAIETFESTFALARVHYGPRLAERQGIIRTRLLDLTTHLESLQ